MIRGSTYPMQRSRRRDSAEIRRLVYESVSLESALIMPSWSLREMRGKHRKSKGNSSGEWII